MRVVVEILPDARVDLLRLVTARSPTPQDGLRAAILYCEEVVRVLTEYRGPPPEAILRTRGETGAWWFFANGIWLAFTKDDEYVGPRPFWRQIKRTLTVVAAATQPPVSEDPR